MTLGPLIAANKATTYWVDNFNSGDKKGGVYKSKNTYYVNITGQLGPKQDVKAWELLAPKEFGILLQNLLIGTDYRKVDLSISPFEKDSRESKNNGQGDGSNESNAESDDDQSEDDKEDESDKKDQKKQDEEEIDYTVTY